ncbi:terminase [Lentzea sp. NPDC102401]|uniref:terminase n=1 Tax=Lentzea sp. NPDC102401 TaxID=3364128 RepID=UPI00383025AB
MLGSTKPRLFTPPLVTGRRGPCGCGCALTPKTSYGFRVVRFAEDILEMPLDPWERWLVIHAGELLPDGSPRFRKVLVIVARQNGKTHVLVVLSLYWLFVERQKLILGTSTNLDYAQESWEKAVEIAEGIEELAERIPARGVRRTNGQNMLRTSAKCRYKIAASNRKGGRSLTVHRLILDELREHPNWKAWSAAYNAMNAVDDAQAFAITNQGDASAVVLKSLRSAAIKSENGVDTLRTDSADPQLGVFEWSAPLGARADDPAALAMANPNLERRGLRLVTLQAEARRAMENGGEELAEFNTEVLCMMVPVLDPAIDAQALERCDISIGVGAARRLKAFSLAAARTRIAAVLDVAPNGSHATLMAGALLDNGKVRVQVVKAWSGEHALRDCAKELPALVKRLKPRLFGWFPKGPAAALAGSLAERKADDPRGVWPPKGVEVIEITSASAVCMQLSAQVQAENLEFNGDLLITAHLVGAEKLHSGDGWRFVRRGAGNCDAAYGTAGVVHLALTMPPPVKAAGRQRVIVAGSSSARQGQNAA